MCCFTYDLLNCSFFFIQSYSYPFYSILLCYIDYEYVDLLSFACACDSYTNIGGPIPESFSVFPYLTQLNIQGTQMMNVSYITALHIFIT